MVIAAVAVCILIFLLFKRKIKYSNTVLAFFLWIVIPLLIYDFSHVYYYWYIFPVYIPILMLGGILIQKLYRYLENKKDCSARSCSYLSLWFPWSVAAP